MAAQTRKDSIIGRVKRMGESFTIVLIAFMSLNLALMFLFEARYEGFLGKIETITSLKPVVYDEIPGDVWEVIAGRKSFLDCKANDLIDQVNQTLLQTRPDRAQVETELVVLQRTLETMRQYVGRIELNMLSNVAIDQSQRLLGDLRDVGSLARDMLEDYITKLIGMESEANRQSRLLFIGCCIVEALLWVVVTLIASAANRNLSAFIKDQLQQLEHFAGELASGHLDTRAPILENQEMEPLTDSLNTMADRLNSLMAQNKIEQENLKKSELRMLQAQINPHFLYNTLDAIMWQAEANNSNEVIHITRALSDFFRISLSSGEEWITVAQEKRHLEGYLSIQKVRYRDILNYSIEIDPEIEGQIVLKLLLQPLVENALYHGIKPRRGGGLIRVTGRQEGDSLLFCVSDTGAGMPPERLQAIRAALRDNSVDISSERGSGFGLKNVNLRIRLYYAQEEGLTIDSDSGGIRVSFRLPAGMKGKGEHV